MVRLLVALAIVAIALPAYTQEPRPLPVPERLQHQQTETDARTKRFISKVTIRNLYEIQSGHLAIDKTRNHLVGDYAKRIIDDHTKISAELTSLAYSIKVLQVLPTQLDARHEKMMEGLRAASAQQFEALYRTQQINAHDEAIRLFKSYAMRSESSLSRLARAKPDRSTCGYYQRGAPRRCSTSWLAPRGA
jgi:putative membrane protein